MDFGQQVLAVLRPETLADFLIYIIFFLSVIALATIPEKNVLSPYLMYVVLLCCVIDLLRGAGGDTIPALNRFVIGGENLLSNNGFITFLIHIIMFTFPLVAGAMVRRQGRKGGLALPMCLLVGLVGGFYAIASFFAPQVVYTPII
jgi:hypothetical protein